VYTGSQLPSPSSGAPEIAQAIHQADASAWRGERDRQKKITEGKKTGGAL